MMSVCEKHKVPLCCTAFEIQGKPTGEGWRRQQKQGLGCLCEQLRCSQRVIWRICGWCASLNVNLCSILLLGALHPFFKKQILGWISPNSGYMDPEFEI